MSVNPITETTEISKEQLINLNEAIKKELNQLKKENERLKEEKQGLIKDWEEKKNLGYEIACKNEKLKAENSILEDEYKILENNLDSRTRDFEDVIDGYKQALKEIKEIASKVLLNTHDLEQFKDADALFGALLEIHKKISEVGDANI